MPTATTRVRERNANTWSGPVPRRVAENSSSEDDSDADKKNEEMQYNGPMLSALVVKSEHVAYWHYKCSKEEGILIAKHNLFL